ncbi:hypothetical protein DPMN_004526 [Dreissena polymorpha]|uniref:Uncharacterized protein n=1 Tax=Dreissena polymorpha TaxID=45954 RepID=A0A9D4RVZ9_DREPO|nr:hypothetical protein DPMN_004526 [Dreissena polymorpha]
MADVTVISEMMNEEEKRIKAFLEQLGQKLKDKKVSVLAFASTVIIVLSVLVSVLAFASTVIIVLSLLVFVLAFASTVIIGECACLCQYCHNWWVWLPLPKINVVTIGNVAFGSVAIVSVGTIWLWTDGKTDGRKDGRTTPKQYPSAYGGG